MTFDLDRVQVINELLYFMRSLQVVIKILWDQLTIGASSQTPPATIKAKSILEIVVLKGQMILLQMTDLS